MTDAAFRSGPGVLVTRPEPDASALGARLSAGGYTPILSPMLEISRAETVTADDVAGVTDVVLTSPRAATALGADVGAAAASALTAHCVGEATAAAARAAGVGRVTVGSGGAAALGRALLAAPPTTRPLLILQGRDVAVDLAAQLASAGRAVRSRVVYQAALAKGLRPAAREAFLHRRVAAALLLSERTARGLAEALDGAGEGVDAGSAIAVCISKRTAETARAARFGTVSVAPRPDLEATLLTLDGLLGGAAGRPSRVC